ncbi:MAG: electron transfer flavoprotein subunit alpha/FixB family protein [Desulfobacterales bacterium]
MGRANPVMVFIECRDHHIAEVSIELICEAGRLAEKIGAPVEAVALGYQIQDDLEVLGQYGCRRVHYLEDKRLAHFTSVPFARAMVKVIKEIEPRIVLFGATKIGRDVAPRVASTLKCGLTADCTALEIGEHRTKDKEYTDILLQIRPAFGGNILATIISPDSTPSMATVRDGVMKRTDPDPAQTTEIVKTDHGLSDEDFLTEVLEVVEKERDVDLKAAKIIVSAGMGACNTESLSLIKELATLLGGEVGASRPVVDSGLLGKDHQVGQTGVAVNPNLYIACGISGQIQHRAGMSGAKRIVAINDNPAAPIFGIAHYGIVGNVMDILPKLIKTFKARNSA